MTRTHLDWINLKKEYKYGDITSVNTFLKVKGIKINGNVSRITSSWRDERDTYRNQLELEIEAKTLDSLSDNEAKIRARHIQYAREIQIKARLGISKYNPSSFNDSVRLLEKAIKIELEALGMNTDEQGKAVTINNQIFPRTRFTEALEKVRDMSGEELITTLEYLKTGMKKVDKNNNLAN